MKTELIHNIRVSPSAHQMFVARGQVCTKTALDICFAKRGAKAVQFHDAFAGKSDQLIARFGLGQCNKVAQITDTQFTQFKRPASFCKIFNGLFQVINVMAINQMEGCFQRSVKSIFLRCLGQIFNTVRQVVNAWARCFCGRIDIPTQPGISKNSQRATSCWSVINGVSCEHRKTFCGCELHLSKHKIVTEL